MPSLPPPVSRQKSSAATRQAMLDAARRRFLLESYENVALRDVAGDVGVDVALVGRYFGGKEQLFREVLGVGRSEEILPPDLPHAEIPRYLARLFMQQGAEGSLPVERLLIILRSASSPSASQIVREAFREDVLQRLAAKLEGDHAELRAASSMVVWMGMTVLCTVMSVEPVCDPDGGIEKRLEQLFEAALADIGPR